MLELRQRVFSTEFAKACARKIYDRPISDDAWRNWREWARIPKRQRTCNFYQLCSVIAIAQIRSEHFDYYPELEGRQIEAIALDCEFQSYVEKAISFIDRNNLVTGEDTVKALELRGLKISQRSLYRKVKGFSKAKVYRLEEILEEISA